MASTPSNRLKLTPSNSPYSHRISRSPMRTRAATCSDSPNTAAPPSASTASSASSRLSLKRVVGSTCCSPTGFDTVNSSFAYIAGGAVVVVDVHGDYYRQRFYRARPSAVPVYSVSPVLQGPSTPTPTPKANDSRNRLAASSSRRDSAFGLPDWAESPTSGKTWTQRERIKSATCLSLSRDGRFLAVGETGYAPRVLIFNLDDTSSSDRPLVSISEHSFGVAAVAWSTDSRYLASLGAANDGFLYIWKIDPRTGSAKLFQQNRCTSYVRGMMWLGTSTLMTFGVRHVKVWRIEDGPGPGSSTSPAKSRSGNDSYVSTPPLSAYQQSKEQTPQQRTLPGRNILLGSLLEATFSCAAALPGGRAVICSETGDICLLESINKQLKLIRVRESGYALSCVSVHNGRIYVGSKKGHSMAIDVDDLLIEGRRIGQLQLASAPSPSTPSLSASSPSLGSKASFSSPSVSSNPSVRPGLVAMGFLTGHVVTIDTTQSIDIISSLDHVPGEDPAPHVTRIPIPGHGEPILGIQALTMPNDANAAFFTWSSSGSILLWNTDGEIQSTLQVPLPIEQTSMGDDFDSVNQLTAVQATAGGTLFVTADRCGVVRIMDFATRKCILETKAHASSCQSISIYEKGSRLLLATCGRDRTAQLFHRLQDGTVEHFQTLEFAAKAVQVLISPDDKIISCSFDRTLQVYDLVSKEDEPDVLAAIPSRVLPLKASPSSMALAPDARTVFVSLLDRTVCQYDLTTSRLLSSFKCLDEGGSESVLLDSLIYGTQGTSTSMPTASSASSTETPFLLGLSNTDKSVRIYDASTGVFLDREWGHTEAINGVALIDSGDEDDERSTSPSKRPGPGPGAGCFSGGCRKVVSVGSDGTIMFWSLDLRDRPATGPVSREPSPAKPVKDGNGQGPTISAAASRPPLRRVLSKAELAEFQRPPTAGSNSNGNGSGASGATGSNTSGKRSPSRVLNRRSSRYNLSIGAGTPGRSQISLLLSRSSRRGSAGSASGSPPATVSPKQKVRRQPSLPSLSTTPTNASSNRSNGNNTNSANTNDTSSHAGSMRKKGSSSSLRSAGFGSLSMATEQTSRQLRTYRKRLTSTDPISQDALDELDEELRLTIAALGDRATRSKAMTEDLDDLLDEKLERLVSMLDKKWSVRRDRERGDGVRSTPSKVRSRGKESQREKEREREYPRHKSTGSGSTAGGSGSGSGSGSGTGSGSGSGSDDDDRADSNSADMDNTSPDENSRPASQTGSVHI